MGLSVFVLGNMLRSMGVEVERVIDDCGTNHALTSVADMEVLR